MKIFYFLLVLLAFASYLLPLETAEASSLSIGISPPLIKIEASGKERIETPLTLHNFGTETVELVITLSPFTQGSQYGVVRVVEQDDRYRLLFQNTALLEEGTKVDRISVPAGKEKSVALAMNVPEDINELDYYFSIIFTASTNVDETKTTSHTNTVGAVATNILLTKQEAVVSGSIKAFSAPRFFEQGPVPFTLGVQNKGKHLIVPRGSIVVHNLLGQRVGVVELSPLNILSKTQRAFPDPLWHESFLLGPYTATLTLSLSETGPTFTRTIRFFAFPIRLFTVLLLSVFIAHLLVTRIRRHIR